MDTGCSSRQTRNAFAPCSNKKTARDASQPNSGSLNQVIAGTKETAPAGGGLGPVEPPRDVPNGRERHGHTIPRNAQWFLSTWQFLCDPRGIAYGTLSGALPNPQNDRDVLLRAHLALEFTFVHSSRNEMATCT